MVMLMNIIYVKAAKKVDIVKKRLVTIGDVAEIEGQGALVNKIKKLVLLRIEKQKKYNTLLSFFDIVKVINNHYKDIIINNAGECDIILSYKPERVKENKLWTAIKAVFVCCIMFFGAALAIMTFHTDAAVPDVFVIVNEIFTGQVVQKPYAIIIPYSIGLAVGIIVFFNHLSSKKLTEDPTPIEVELRNYERDVEDCIIETLASEKKGEKDG